ncbi:MAG: hypothetical protein QY323_05210 [Patescibacteria group bacterium]|nr:MAG: hypothetical protein QY323_05210 [Patescibacteria group bacterium]
MRELFIDLNAFNALDVTPLQEGEPAKRYAARLASRHPVRQLLSGESQWLGRNKAVYVFLRLFSDTYAQYFRRANDNGHLRTMAPLDQAAILRERDEFFRLFPRDVIYRGRLEDLHRWWLRASAAVDDAYGHIPAVHSAARAAFDTTFALLVRTVRSFPPPPPSRRTALAAFAPYVVPSSP